MTATRTLRELPGLHGRAPVFRDREAAGASLAGMLQGYHERDALVLAIPAGGVPVAAEIAARLALPLDVAPVSKVLLLWTTEGGYGAVAFDGTVWIDDDAAQRFGLSEKQVEHGIAEARAKVERRMARLRDGRPVSGFTGRPVILVDDGIAAGSTMRTAIRAVRQQVAIRVVVAVPQDTSRHWRSSRSLPMRCIAPISAAAAASPLPMLTTSGATSARMKWRLSSNEISARGKRVIAASLVS